MTADGRDPERKYKSGRRNPSSIGEPEACIWAALNPKVVEAVRVYKLAEENRKAVLRSQLKAEKKLVHPKYGSATTRLTYRGIGRVRCLGGN